MKCIFYSFTQPVIHIWKNFDRGLCESLICLYTIKIWSMDSFNFILWEIIYLIIICFSYRRLSSRILLFTWCSVSQQPYSGCNWWSMPHWSLLSSWYIWPDRLSSRYLQSTIGTIRMHTMHARLLLSCKCVRLHTIPLSGGTFLSEWNTLCQRKSVPEWQVLESYQWTRRVWLFVM